MLTIMEDKLFKCSEEANMSGQYEIVGPREGKIEGREITMIKGKKSPSV